MRHKALLTQADVALNAVRVPRPLKRAPPLPTGVERHAVLSRPACGRAQVRMQEASVIARWRRWWLMTTGWGR